MKAGDFIRFFRAVNGQEAFPWQCRLAESLCQGTWPGAVHVPTGCGKTSILDAFTFALAFHAAKKFPRRLFYVIDRRLVVDDILGHAQQLAAKLANALLTPEAVDAILLTVAKRLATLSVEGRPLVACAMRGGGRLELDWAVAPDTPALVISTADQAGSRLLFQGYGTSEYARPVHAGLAGCDAAFVLDEAHLSQPFAQTLLRAAKWSRLASNPVSAPPVVVQVTATPAGVKKQVVRLEKDDKANAEIERRTCRPKLVELREAAAGEFATVAAAAARDLLRQADVQVVGVVVNRVQRARDIFNRLRTDQRLEAFLLTGRIRPVDRGRLLQQVLPRCHASRERAQTPCRTVIVATQTIEVGANLDFDAMVTESAPLPALRQRFGRLNRLGLRESAEAIILHLVPDKSVADRADPIYGHALAAHWKWLRQLEMKLPRPKRKRGEPPPSTPRLDFASEVFPRQAALADGEPPVPERDAPWFLEAHARLLAHTSPSPEPQPDISVWLHGVDSAPAEVYVAWRADFTESNRAAWPQLAAMLPPYADELMPLPYGSFRRWMAGTTATIADVEGETDSGWRAQPNAPVLRWDADEPALITAAQVRPGDTVVLPATLGGCDQFGFDPNSGPVSDVAEAANAARLAAIGRKGLLQLRLHPALLSPELAVELRQLLEQVEAGEDTVNQTACALARKCFAETPHEQLHTAVVQLESEQLVACSWYPVRHSEGLLLKFEVDCFSRGKGAKSRGRAGRIVFLEDHSLRVAQRARTYAERCGLPKPLQRALELAGLGHDLGKAAPPFQRMLRGGEMERAAGMQLAKSLPGVYAMTPEAWRGWRHEALSAALLATADPQGYAGVDWGLVRWLAGTSHGRGRPFFAADGERPEESVTVSFDGAPLAGSTRHGLDRLESGWVELFHRLNQRYGWWGLAWLEAILRLADQQISAEETQ